MSPFKKTSNDLNIRITSGEDLDVFEEVGRGGFGIVYRGVIKSLNKEVAIKQIDLEKDSTDLIEVNKEIQIISDCRLPQITSYFGSFVKNYKLWVIMEFVDGGSIFELLRPGPIDDEIVIAGVAKEILLALEYLHNQGKIHRDLKSQNILVNKEGEIKLTDFGVSTQLSSNFSKRNTTVGTPYWMAPEVILNNQGGHSFKADIWSLGCCCFEMLTSKPPLQNDYTPMKALQLISRCQSKKDFVQLIKLDELNVSPSFKKFLECCFIEIPKDRHSATRLLKHPFIQQDLTNWNKLLKRSITRKHSWDMSNFVDDKRNFYIPTETHQTRSKRKNVNEQSVNGLNFEYNEHDDDTANRASSQVSELRSSHSHNEKLDLTSNSFEGLSLKVIETVEAKLCMTTSQKMILQGIHSLIKDTYKEEDANVLYQYTKYMYKELSKAMNKNSAGKTIPSMTRQSASSNEIELFSSSKGKNNKFDEIEENLLASWISKMNT